jgi:hypothetical protein
VRERETFRFFQGSNSLLRSTESKASRLEKK